MNVVLFTWNPDKWNIPTRQWNREIRQIQDCGFRYSQWSVGNSTKIVRPGDTALLLRQTRDRGIVAKGTVTSEVFEEISWNEELEKDATDHYVEITWSTQLPIDKRLRLEDLQTLLPDVSWVRYSSGTTVDPKFHDQLMTLWDQTVRSAGLHPTPTAQQIPAPEALVQKQNGFCAICGLNPTTIYQTQSAGFFLTHTFDTTSIQIAICPNCKLFASIFPIAATPDELKQLMSAQF